MGDEVKFFRPDWRKAAMESCNANEEMHQGVKDRKNFTHRREFACVDPGRPWGPCRLCRGAGGGVGSPDVRLQRSLADSSRPTSTRGGKSRKARARVSSSSWAGRIKFVKAPISKSTVAVTLASGIHHPSPRRELQFCVSKLEVTQC